MLGLSFGLCVTAFAQTSFDAAKVYNMELSGTARYVAMGGAMAALGSDISIISQNPAGIGTYHQSDVNISSSLTGAESRMSPMYTSSHTGFDNGCTYYSHNTKSGIDGKLIDNMSFVFCGDEDYGDYANFGFSFRRLKNTNCDLDYIDEFDDSDGYTVFREFRDHSENIVSAFDFNLSCNLDDVVYFGGNFEVQNVETWSNGYFYDYYDKGVLPDYPDGFDYTCLDMGTSMDGYGINASFGLIFRPVPVLRIGMSFKTPTWYQLHLLYNDNLYALRGEEKSGDTYSKHVDFAFSSPWSYNLSAGLTMGRTALGMEFERNWTSRSYLSKSNVKIYNQGGAQYRDFSTIRFGLEHNIDKLALRAGCSHTGSMFRKDATPSFLDTDFNDSRMDFQCIRPGSLNYVTCGFGYCSAPTEFGTQFYADMAFVHGVQKQKVCLMEYDEDPVVNYKYISNKLQLTIGWCF